MDRKDGCVNYDYFKTTFYLYIGIYKAYLLIRLKLELLMSTESRESFILGIIQLGDSTIILKIININPTC